MDPDRERIQADLTGLVEGEVRCDDIFLQLYASDASIFEIRPLAVVRPKTVEDVSRVVKYAAEEHIPIHPRGAGSGVAGESLGPGIVLDFSTYMRRILHVDEATVRVQPGVVLAQLNRFLLTRNRLFGPDPATRSITTLGSVLALDGAGSHWLKYGSARHKVVSLQVVLATGDVIEASQHPIPADDATDLSPLGEIVRRVASLARREATVIEERRPRTKVNRSGYHLNDIIHENELDLARVIVGSEGTLGLITEATIRTDPLPRFRGLALLFFDRLESAARGAFEIREMGIAACDLMDRRLLTLAREIDGRYDRILPRDAEAILIVEVQSDTEPELRQSLEAVVRKLQFEQRLAFDSRTTTDRSDRDLFWKMARRVVPSLYKVSGAERPIPFVEDIAVPPEELASFLPQLQSILRNHDVTASFFAHAGHGQIHLRPFLNLASDLDVRKMQDLATDIYQAVIARGGTISGEHGAGLSRTWFVKEQYGPLYDVFREVKRIFDPGNLLNPGKVVADAPQPLIKNLRPPLLANAAGHTETRGKKPDKSEEAPAASVVQLQLAWNPGEFEYAATQCNGCGRCRTQGADARMCPIFRLAPAEEASPRAKANLVRAVLSGRLPAKELTTDIAKEVADLCVHCHQCRDECPAGVDIPKLMVEAKAQYVASSGLRAEEWYMAHIEGLARWGGRFATISNFILANRTMRWILSRLTGIAEGRKLPRFASTSFLAKAASKRWTRPARQAERRVLYFVDLYANYFDTELAEAVVAVLRRHGYAVHVHPRQISSGMPAISLGAVELAAKIARRNTRYLAEAVRQGYQIVTSEPSAAMCLRHEYVNLLGDDESRLVADNSLDITSFLFKLHQAGKLELDFKPINLTVGYHQPCHLRTYGASGDLLLKQIPGLTVQTIEKGCSGMAGTFGLLSSNYRASLRAGLGLINALRDPAIHVGATECSACKLQMEQGTNKPTIHPVKLLALSYGLMPGIEQSLKRRSEELVVT
jgi:FAD/FMN-containing dehydrogenase/Fe-S oxidoreductase